MINRLSDTPETHIASHVLHINNTSEMCKAWEAFPCANPTVSRRVPCKCKHKNNSDYRLSNVEKITSTILPLASNILFPPLPFRLFSNLSSVTMPALLLRISSKIAQKCRCKIAELILSTLLTSVLLSLFPQIATIMSAKIRINFPVEK